MERSPMQRRKFIIGMGALASGTAAAVGSGAFTSVTASRNVDVEVADDASAYLRLEGSNGPNGDYVTDDGVGSTLEIDLSPSNDNVEGSGVNPDALTEIKYVFYIENQGTQEVDVELDKFGDNADLVTFYADDEAFDGDTLGDTPVTLDTGESAKVSIKIDTRDSGLGDGDELLDSVVFNANAN